MNVEIKGDIPWVEKYRPLNLNEVVGNKENMNRFRAIAETGNCPHLLLSGPPGCGKTTTIHCLARQLLGNKYSDGVLELNASDDRGINVVRTKIKNFANKKVSLPPGRHKIIILDEADSMTSAAQQALRRTMELHSKTTRFALACNISSKIIEPIQSRCAIVRFTRLTNEQILDRLLCVAKAENIKYTNNGLQSLLFVSNGDLRNGINSMQATAAGFDIVDDKTVFKVCDEPHPKFIQKMLVCCKDKDINGALAIIDKLYKEGYASVDLIGTIFRVCKDLTVDENTKLQFMKEVGETHRRILNGVNGLLQLSGLCARLCQVK